MEIVEYTMIRRCVITEGIEHKTFQDDEKCESTESLTEFVIEPNAHSVENETALKVELEGSQKRLTVAK